MTGLVDRFKMGFPEYGLHVNAQKTRIMSSLPGEDPIMEWCGLHVHLNAFDLTSAFDKSGSTGIADGMIITKRTPSLQHLTERSIGFDLFPTVQMMHTEAIG